MGRPGENNALQFDSCLNRYTRAGFFSYELLNPDGSLAAPGKKQAWCSEDSAPFPESTAPSRGPARYSCDYQGISVGWMDIYESSIDCQWIDVTDVVPGVYTLRVAVNEDRSIEETNYDNNVKEMDVTIQ